MYIEELYFTEYYHQYVVIEADTLTDRLRDVIEIDEDDCFVLCSTHINQDGFLQFHVLSVGNDWEHCQKGLRRKDILGIFDPDEIMDCEVRLLQPTLQMTKKNKAWLEKNEPEVDVELELTRNDGRLDEVRNYFYPDIVQVGILKGSHIKEYNMKLIQFNGPFVEGRFLAIPEDEKTIEENDLCRALPYLIGDQIHLLAIFTGNQLSVEDENAMKEIIKRSREFGLGFDAFHLKS